MTRKEIEAEATQQGCGQIHFQFNIARNGGKQFEVGYCFVNGQRELFCKRQPNDGLDAFYLCNDFAKRRDERNQKR